MMRSGWVWLGCVLWSGSALGADLIWQADLDSDDGGFTVAGETGQWSWNEVTTGPQTCFSGTVCWATLPQGAYLHEATDYLVFPALDLTGVASASLVFEHWMQVSANDLGTLEADVGGVWTTLTPAYGYPSGTGFSEITGDWESVYFSLEGLGDDVSLRLSFVTGETGTGDGWYVDDFSVYDGDIAPPFVSSVTELPDTENVEGPYTVSATVVDDVLLTNVWLEFAVDSGTVIQVQMTDQGGGLWAGEIPGQESGHLVTYWVIAEDAENQSVSPPDGWTFSVRLPPPTDLAGPDASVHGAESTLTWSAPESGHALEGYGVYRDGVWVAEVVTESADVALQNGTQSFAVTALYDVGESALSETFDVVAAVPELQSVSPTVGYQGDWLRIEIVGAYLLMVDGEVTLDLGEGVVIETAEVRDVDTLIVTVTIDEQADPGLRDCTVTSAGWEATLSAAFEVFDGADRPRLTSVSPDFLTQGESTVLTVEASGAFADQPTVFLGDGVVVEMVQLVDSDTVEVSVAIAWDAALGERVVEVDDGVRLLDDVTVRVRDYVVEVPRGRCSTAADSGLGGGWFVALLVGIRRRHTKRSAAPEIPFVNASSTRKA